MTLLAFGLSHSSFLLGLCVQAGEVFCKGVPGGRYSLGRPAHPAVDGELVSIFSFNDVMKIH